MFAMQPVVALRLPPASFCDPPAPTVRHQGVGKEAASGSWWRRHCG